MKKKTKAIALGIFFWGFCFTSFANGAAEEFPVAPPPMTEGMFPCSNCHATMEVNRKKTRTERRTYSDIKLHHAETMRWCLDCHDAKNRDKLRLYNGELINFTESYRLCGECHGPHTETGEQAFMEKERDTLWALGKEPTSSVLTATTPMSQNLNR